MAEKLPPTMPLVHKTDVAIYVAAPFARFVLSGSSLELHTSEDGFHWVRVAETDVGEATPIVSQALQALAGFYPRG